MKELLSTVMKRCVALVAVVATLVGCAAVSMVMPSSALADETSTTQSTDNGDAGNQAESVTTDDDDSDSKDTDNSTANNETPANLASKNADNTVTSQAADSSTTIKNNDGIILSSSIKKNRVIKITFADTINVPSGAIQWNAAEDGSAGVTAWATATNSTVFANYRVTYACNGVYPSFPDFSNSLFATFDSLRDIVNLDKIDTSNVSSMAAMFGLSRSLTSLDLSSFNTSGVTNMKNMFFCLRLRKLVLGDKFSFNGAGSYRQDTELDAPGAKAGYTASDWVNEATGVAYAPADIPNNVAATYVGGYIANTYSVKFDAGAADATGTMADEQFIYDQEQALTANAFARSGYVFAGWKDDKGNTYTDGQAVKNLTAAADDTVTLTAQWTPDDPAAGKLLREAGDTRYDTMDKLVSTGSWSTGGTVIVVSGENYPDALAASGLAGALNAPIVSTKPKELTSQSADTLKQLAPSRIIVIGGTAAVSDNVFNSLKSYASDVTRIAGASRVETALNVYTEGTKLGASWGKTAVVSTADNFADALSVSSFAYSGKAPLFLVKQTLSDDQLAAMKAAGFTQVLVVGGTKAVSHAVTGQIAETGVLPTRLSGTTRYETSVKIAEWAAKNAGMSVSGAVFATGKNFPDALAAGPLAGRYNGVLLLVDPKDPSTVINYVQAFKGKVTHAYVAGGTNAVSNDTASKLADSLGLKLE